MLQISGQQEKQTQTGLALKIKRHDKRDVFYEGIYYLHEESIINQWINTHNQ